MRERELVQRAQAVRAATAPGDAARPVERALLTIQAQAGNRAVARAVAANRTLSRDMGKDRAAVVKDAKAEASQLPGQVLSAVDLYQEVADKNSRAALVLLRRIHAMCLGWLRTKTPQAVTPASGPVGDAVAAVRGLSRAVAVEITRLEKRTTGYNERTETVIKEDYASGNINSVALLDYPGFRSVFKPDQDIGAKVPWSAMMAGLPGTNSALSNRTMAMYRLDQLLGTNVIPRTEFASHGGRPGIAMGFASGISPQENFQEGREKMSITQFITRVRDHDPEAFTPQLFGPHAALKAGVDARVNAERRALYREGAVRRDLFNLQLLDAVSGQVDRHAENLRVRREGVQGIDNDFGFGARLGPNPQSHNKGLPALVDGAVAARVLSLHEEDIRHTIEGLINEEEVKATLERWRQVVAHVRKLTVEGGIVASLEAWAAVESSSFGLTPIDRRSPYAIENELLRGRKDERNYFY
jgi:hypothetical protein